jgi:hypothetical protein
MGRRFRAIKLEQLRAQSSSTAEFSIAQQTQNILAKVSETAEESENDMQIATTFWRNSGALGVADGSQTSPQCLAYDQLRLNG